MEQLLRVPPGSDLDLGSIDTRATPGYDGDKDASRAAFEAQRTRLAELQHLLYASSTERLLLVLQAMDTGGKEGTISHVFKDVNPTGLRHQWFQKPPAAEQ